MTFVIAVVTVANFLSKFVCNSSLFSSVDAVLAIFSGGERFSKSVGGIGLLFDRSSLHLVLLGIVYNMVAASWDFDGMTYFFSRHDPFTEGGMM